MFEADRINIYYGKKQIIFDVSLKLHEAERVLFVGPNGAGKSTFMRGLAGMAPVSSGSIYFQNKNITTATTAKRIKCGMAYLLQTGNIVPSLSVEENLFLAGYPYSRPRIESQLEAIFEIFPFLRKIRQTRSGFLSGGERQALAISMVLLKKPVMLLLDEPSAGLSPKAASKIFECITHARSLLGIKTICMVEHRLRESLPWASRLIVMTGGRAVHDTTNHREYLNNPRELERFYF